MVDVVHKPVDDDKQRRTYGHLLIFSVFDLEHVVPIHLIFNLAHHHHKCSAQGQILHCKHRHQSCNSAEKAGLPLQTQEPRLQFY